MKLFNKLSLIIKSFEKNLPENKIYVLPTWSGIKILILFVVLVVLGLIYTNNYIIFLAFFVFFFLLLSIFLTYENFKPLLGVNILLNSCFAKETSRGKIIFQTNQDQVLFGLSCSSSNKLIHLTSNEYKKSFSGQDQFIDIMAVQRGYYEKLRLKIESTFPFNWFRCFSFFEVNLNCYVYPFPKISTTHTYTSTQKTDSDPEVDIKDYLAGEPLSRVLWKKSHQTPLQTKFLNENQARSLSINLDLVKSEDELSELSYILKNIQDENLFVSLQIKNSFTSGRGKAFAKTCLMAVSTYEL